MAIDGEVGVRRTTVGELLEEDLRIPPYQRPYRWTPETALQLVDDIRDARRRSVAHGDSDYVLGAVILHRDKDDDRDDLNVVDGQQRLLTLALLLTILDSWPDEQHTNDTTSPPAGTGAPIVEVRRRLSSRIRRLSRDDTEFSPDDLARFIRTHCVLVRIETDDIDEAFKVFDSQNYRGKALLPHDLLKAYHLRALTTETTAMKTALVHRWENTKAADIDRLFSTYLWRIHRWSRGEPAPPFRARHIDVFKGVRSSGTDLPSARYHIAAQSSLPLLTAFGSDIDQRSQNRARFQLDAPVQAGRPFFEMVDFLLGEMRTLRTEAFSTDDWEKFAGVDQELAGNRDKPRLRYVTELYLAALLAYTNKFGDDDLVEARHHLFRWAFSLRTKLRRVQMASVDKRARGDEGEGQPDAVVSVFRRIRDSTSPRFLAGIPVPTGDDEPASEHDEDLAKLLKDIAE